MLTLQKQVRENQVELQEYLADLDSWTSDIAVKEKTLVKHKHTDEPVLYSCKFYDDILLVLVMLSISSSRRVLLYKI